MSNHISK
jgi:hypothetical protein